MPTALLDDRALINVSGADAETFLQNIVTTDLDALQPGEVKPGALLSPQGKILFDFLIWRRSNGELTLDCRRDAAADFVKHLSLYRLRANAEISVDDQALVEIGWADDSDRSRPDSSPSETTSIEPEALLDRRFGQAHGVARRYRQGAGSASNLDAWTRFRILHGVAESGTDYQLGDAFPHDVLLDQHDGVGFKKGCYIGQEVVSRMQHRGTARRRVLVAEGTQPLAAPGTDVIADGRTIGTLGSVVGNHGLAISRVDKVKAAVDAGSTIEAGGSVLQLRLPPGVNFSWPESQADGA